MTVPHPVLPTDNPATRHQFESHHCTRLSLLYTFAVASGRPRIDVSNDLARQHHATIVETQRTMELWAGVRETRRSPYRDGIQDFAFGGQYHRSQLLTAAGYLELLAEQLQQLAIPSRNGLDSIAGHLLRQHAIPQYT